MSNKINTATDNATRNATRNAIRNVADIVTRNALNQLLDHVE